ncbi:TfoX/Sxy family protein [Aestuariispira insulae]|nr:TfoX/Sxy family protein [Aestuariispira insulae]
MPFDSGLAARLEEIITDRFAPIGGLSETRMFGGFGYMLNGNMCLGIHKDTLIVRVGLECADEILAEDHVGPMNLTGRVMKGWATIQPAAMEEDDALARFVRLAIDFVSTLPPKEK